MFRKFILTLAFLMPVAIFAQSTPQEWLKVIDRNLNPPEYEAYRKLINKM